MQSNTNSIELLSNVIHWMKYARYLDSESRRETFVETVTRNKGMHLKRFPFLREEIEWAYEKVYNKYVLPSMRSMQFAGKAVELAPNRIYNCAYLPIDDVKAFREIMFLLLGGSGVGYSVQYQHVRQLPRIRRPFGEYRWVVQDSQIGWANAVDALVKSYFTGRPRPRFDFRDIRPAGTPLETSGGKAPGPEPLRKTLERVEGVLDRKKENERLTPIEVHDICCHIADGVLAGGIRRAALISLFSFDDKEMRYAKRGEWWRDNPQRARANNSAVALRYRISEFDFFDLWEDIVTIGTGEPGIYFTNNSDWGANPCVEIALRPNQFCNLTEVDIAQIQNDRQLYERVKAATIIGSLQAAYTDFHYIRPIWKKTTEKEALLGVSLTGLASESAYDLDLEGAANLAKEVNWNMAQRLGINPAARVTTVKPSGTASLVFGTSSGVHAWHAPYYIRRKQVHKNEEIYRYLKAVVPELVVDSVYNPERDAVIETPVKAPDDAITRHDETAVDFLERVKATNERWVFKGHRSGDNRNNTSATVNIKDHEWQEVGEWMWANRGSYNGLSTLPYDPTSYEQTPFEEISRSEYEEMARHLQNIDLTQINEDTDYTDLRGEIACGGGACEIV